MAANKVLDDIEKRVKERFDKEMAALRILRQAGSLDGQKWESMPKLVPLAPSFSESDLEAACNRIINGGSGHAYYRVSEVINRLNQEGIGSGEDSRKFRRMLRTVLDRMDKKGVIKKKGRRGRAGTIYMPKKTEAKQQQ